MTPVPNSSSGESGIIQTTVLTLLKVESRNEAEPIARDPPAEDSGTSLNPTPTLVMVIDLHIHPSPCMEAQREVMSVRSGLLATGGLLTR